VLTLELAGMAPTGEAIGRHAGMVVFVPFGLPGELVDVQLVTQKRNFARGEILRRHNDAPARVAPRCPYFGVCGGCDWQHAAYPEQLRFKTAIVAEQLARIGKLPDPPVRPCLGSPADYEYRNHVRMQRAPDGRPGYLQARSHAVVPVQDCPIAEPAIRRQIAHLNTAAAPAGASAGAGAVEFEDASGEIELRTWHDTIAVSHETYRAGAGAFFQANTAVAALLVDAVLEALALKGDEHVLDLYCGVGLFTVPISRRAASVAGVEANPAAAAAAIANLAQPPAPGQPTTEAAGTSPAQLGAPGQLAAETAGKSLVQPPAQGQLAAETAGKIPVQSPAQRQIITGDVAAALRSAELAGRRWDAVVLDPPRTGVEPEALAALIALAPPRLLYISCDPATLARDLRHLLDGGYTLEWAQPFDMFPQTRHVETLALLSRP
jgi:23S rRNA (uracil1939-C5)-methyltransferase